MSNDFDTDYNVDDDRRGNINRIATSQFNRRDALARFAAAATTAALFGGNPAMAATEASSTEFSESPTSDAAIARMGYDGKTPPPPEPSASPAEAEVEAPAPVKAAPVKAAKPDFDGNEAGSVGATDEGSQPRAKTAVDRSRLDPGVSLPSMAKLTENLADVDPIIIGGSVAILSVLTIAGTVAGSGGDEGEAATPNPLAKQGPPAVAYGLDQGRNYWEGVDMNAAKQAGLVAPPTPKQEEPAAQVVAVVEVEKKEEEVQPSWVLKKPTPYGIENKAGTNPFIKDVLDYCEGGKVTEPCTESIKGYLDEIAVTGAVATSGEANAIAGYLNTLGDGEASTTPGKKVGAAFTSYLDALSGGSAPPPSSAKAVKTYLDTLNGTVDAAASSKAMSESLQQSPIVEAAWEQPEAVVEAPEPMYQGPDMSEFDGRLTNIEGRVTNLEIKVDQIPDQVFAKVEAWQSMHEERLTNEVKKIVEALTPPPVSTPEPVAEPVVMEAPEPMAEAPTPEPQPEPVATRPIVQATPLGAIPLRPSMPQAGSGPKKGYGFGGGGGWKTSEPARPSMPQAGSGPKKGYGFGGGGGWKTSNSSSPTPVPEQPVAAYVPEPEPVQTAPIVPATPLVAAIPARPSMPQAGSGPKKGYGFGGGGGWKTSEPSSGGGGGYLDNMNP
eukprot:CAMPEP_0201949002 /NCGR_PEP_ID=MMETSP0903-20130614/55752_1 /ASSEMBLY_ACC=CAM_ASM_000552 /TAXON_ID=420261 /ORGANISM="Thalassiosira antarctica, Strain CCMP982" /LENGTH=665 /DNA_ID=CAMNT_0048492199 /DNA_START=87 /DNA_END=2084 /DNA_ORIENTATION=-